MTSRILISVLSLLFLFSAGCREHSREQNDRSGEDTGMNSVDERLIKMELRTLENKDNTWGYDIYVEEKLVIHQPQRPALGGNMGFEREITARKAGELMMAKMSRGIMPPSLSAVEVDSLIEQFDHEN